MYEWSIYTIDNELQVNRTKYSNRCSTIREARREMTDIIAELIKAGNLISCCEILYIGE